MRQQGRPHHGPRLTVRARVGAAALCAVAVLAGGCSSGNGSADDAAPLVVATTSVWADVTENVACDDSVRIRSLVPPAADAHAFEPSLADRADLERARLVVANGLGLEDVLADTLEAVESAGTPVFRLGEHVETLPASDEHRDGGEDPHVWFDPLRVSGALPELAAALIDEVGLDPAAVERCLARYQGELEALDEDVAAVFAAIPSERRELVTNHDALSYLADRYGFEIVGSVLPSSSTLAAPNPADLEALAAVIRDRGIEAVVVEGTEATSDVTALADRIGVAVLVLPAGVGAPAGGADTSTYAAYLRTTAGLIAEALTPSP